jgi:ADP-heptose:LPS heptosyltransferase
MTLASRAAIRAGFAHHICSPLYNTRIPTAQEILGISRKVHTAEHLASAIFYLGVPIAEVPRARLAAAKPPAFPPYAVFHPFASAPEKTWPAERFLTVAAQLRGLEPVFLAEAQDTRAFERYRVFRERPLAEVKSLLCGAQMFIGNDSGPAHIAAAFGVPVVTIFAASDPLIWGPWKTESQILTGAAMPEDVLAAVESLRVRA